MFKRVLLSSLIGGVIAYAWMMVSWMFLPYHAQTIHQFKDEAAVVATIQANVDGSGIYHYPAFTAKKTDDQVQANEENGKEENGKNGEQDAMKKMEEGPCIFLSYHADGTSMTTQTIQGVASHVIGAFLLALLMLFAARSNFFCRFGFTVIFAATVGFLAAAPLYIWWRFDMNYICLDFMDYFIAWSAAGFAMSLIMKRSE